MSPAVSAPDRLRALAGAVRRPRELLRRDWPRALVLGVLTGLEFAAFNPSGDDVLNGPLALALALPAVAFVVVVRRHLPVVAMIGAVLTSSMVPAGITIVAFASYGVGYRVMRVGVTWAAIGLITLADIGIWLGRVTPWDVETASVAFVMVLVLVVPALFGRYHRQRAALVMSGWERAERLEHERSMMIEQARLRERTRIAREMHDSLGHDLSLIALQAGALELDPAVPERQRETARTLRTTTTDAMERLREVIGVLRDDRAPDGAPTQPASESLEALVERAASSGVDVRLESDAEDVESATPPPMAERAVYSMVREGITNATKHAPGAPIVVRVRRTTTETTATVENPLVESASEPGADSGGIGLIGLAERMRLVGGDLVTSTAGGVFAVRARVPHHEPLRDDAAPTAPKSALPKYQPSVDELTEIYERTAPVGRLRRRLWLWLVTPMALVVIAFALVMTYVGMDRSTMTVETYAELRVGMPQQDAAELLPTVQQSPPELDRAEPPRPVTASCRYYAPRLDGWMWPDFDRTYRICFADGRLASADLIDHHHSPRTSHQAGAEPGTREGVT